MADTKAEPSKGAGAGPAPSAGSFTQVEKPTTSVPGFAGPKNPPPGPALETAAAQQRRLDAVQKPKLVFDKDGRDITPGYAGPKNPASGAMPNNPPPDPPVHPDPVTPADPRPGDYKPGHSGGVPTPPYSVFDEVKVDEPNKKETK